MKSEDPRTFAVITSMLVRLSPLARLLSTGNRTVLYSVDRPELAAIIVHLNLVCTKETGGVLRLPALISALRSLERFEISLEEEGLVIRGRTKKSKSPMCMKMELIDLEYPPLPDVNEQVLGTVESYSFAECLDILKNSVVEELVFSIGDGAVRITGIGFGVNVALEISTINEVHDPIRFTIPANYADVLRMLARISPSISISRGGTELAVFTGRVQSKEIRKVALVLSAREYE